VDRQCHIRLKARDSRILRWVLNANDLHTPGTQSVLDSRQLSDYHAPTVSPLPGGKLRWSRSGGESRIPLPEGGWLTNLPEISRLKISSVAKSVKQNVCPARRIYPEKQSNLANGAPQGAPHKCVTQVAWAEVAAPTTAGDCERPHILPENTAPVERAIAS
jgi:hypothetical protein